MMATEPPSLAAELPASVPQLPPPTADEQTPYRDLTGSVVTSEPHYFAYGGFSEIWRGDMTDMSSGQEVVIPVAIKVFRGVHTDPLVLTTITRRLNRESRVWHRLHHPNILPFYGIVSGLFPSPALVSPFCRDRDALQYLDTHPDVNRLDIIAGVARGLEYLHSEGVVHGDMKGHNVLIDDSGTPRLGDFGRSKLIGHRGFTTAFSGSARFLAPELITNNDIDTNTNTELQNTSADQFTPNLTKETDVYGFSMCSLQIFSGKLPYFYFKLDSVVLFKVQDGLRPNKAKYASLQIPDDLWEVLEQCWARQPGERPTISVVVKSLTGG